MHLFLCRLGVKVRPGKPLPQVARTMNHEESMILVFPLLFTRTKKGGPLEISSLLLYAILGYKYINIFRIVFPVTFLTLTFDIFSEGKMIT